MSNVLHHLEAGSSAAEPDPVLLKRLRDSRSAWKPLEGKILALISASEDSPMSASFRRAAIALGARVAWMRPSLGADSEPEVISATGRVLGKLYDGIECQDLDPEIAAAIASVAGVPVFMSRADDSDASTAVGDEAELTLQLRLLRALA